ncbi:PilW family protein [Acidithiobacillus sulfuriphilus]|uniref:Prepilin-type N-terminal cleavage/methylation domain-containing protein n=2 Tax=Acidithiobacillus sulfuriphilus TaxID=1867749 RepID=A0A3M8RAN5_9PROT|nr:prepilin-type N-terminal cleavage/methylation domain-containing protein [Acidithiobacillus sulfuriphilus]RNF64214.1 prepilin-type N-terminal cleavage/methylation domain-containing protein [Acidithiobacillus sulfuriphilus]
MTRTGIPQRPGVFAGPGLTQGGLTLIELIVAIVILGILSVGATALIVRSVQNYQTNRAASELASQGEMALTAMARGLHNAQPGSLSLTGGTLSFTRCTAPASAAASVCSPGYGFAFTGTQLQQTTPGPGGYTAQVLAAPASGGFALLPADSTASGVFVTLTVSNATADVGLTLSRAIAVLSSAYSVVNNQ